MDLWSPPPGWGVGAHAKHLKNLYVYFWRWATLKVFGSGHREAVGGNKDGSGIICFITVAGFLNGPGFQKMREDLRRDCAAIWVIDCSPEGHQPAVNTRIFQGVQQPVCIVLAARTPGKDRSIPAKLKFMALPEGHREHVKFAALAELSLKSEDWVDGPSGWRAPFLPDRQRALGLVCHRYEIFLTGPWSRRHSRANWLNCADEATLDRALARLVQREATDRQRKRLFHRSACGGTAAAHQQSRENWRLGLHEFRSLAMCAMTMDIGTSIQYAMPFSSLIGNGSSPDHRLTQIAGVRSYGDHVSDGQIVSNWPLKRIAHLRYLR